MLILQISFILAYVKKGTKGNIKRESDGGRSAILYFYNQECKDCEEALNVIEKSQTKLDGVITFLKVDCSSEGMLKTCTEYKIKKYPYMLMINAQNEKGKPEIFLDDYTESEVTEWALDFFRLPFAVSPKAEAILPFLENPKDEGQQLTMFYFIREERPKIWMMKLAFELMKSGMKNIWQKGWDETNAVTLRGTVFKTVPAAKSTMAAMTPQGAVFVFPLDKELTQTNVLTWIQDIATKLQADAKSDI